MGYTVLGHRHTTQGYLSFAAVDPSVVVARTVGALGTARSKEVRGLYRGRT